ncbi:hypothetical protein MLD38_020918 [Melastoma candidum]|uniref:Uncharacterized protein n=1 Tax=Melastoma candidum TaxID=119954 RepID=A0ACB9QEK0_9MYRT|nr:hypothetical protein MLD38_020918 [Melastoma candidum]
MKEENGPSISERERDAGTSGAGVGAGAGGGGWFWRWTMSAVAFRLILIYSFPQNLDLSSRPEVSTPVTSLRRLSEGYWLKQKSMSPYSGSMYHGSPLLMLLLGPLTVKSTQGQPDHMLCSLLFVATDVINAMLIRATGQSLQMAFGRHVKALDLAKLSYHPGALPSGDIAAAVYLWNPFSIIACVGLSTSSIENLAVLLSIYGACTGVIPVAAFGWVMATHMSLYPAILIVPVILLLGNGPDSPPKKLLLQRKHPDSDSRDSCSGKQETLRDNLESQNFSWSRGVCFFLWASFWGFYVMFLSGLIMREHGGLLEMFKRTYGFILTVKDLTPNIGVLWYFFAEVFEFFRSFFLIVFHANILLMTIPLSIRLKHRPCFMAFVCVAISSMFKSYPSVGDSALYLSLLALFVNELTDFKFAFFLFCGYVGVSLLSPVMHNLWIWRGTGNANFYYATAMAYACFQIILVVESVGAMLNHDRLLVKLSAMTTKPTGEKSST